MPNALLSSRQPPIMSDQQTTPRSYLLKLPDELLSEVFSHLAIWDCNSLQDTQKHDRLGKINQDRKAFDLHLNKHKFNGSGWLEMMCQTGAYLVDERAFEFICPGCTPGSSAWKFVLSNCARRIEKFMKFMKFMEGEGFRWDTYHDVVQAKFAKKERVFISKERLAAANAFTNNNNNNNNRLLELPNLGEDSSSPFIDAQPLANGNYRYTPADQIAKSHLTKDFLVHKGRLTRDGVIHHIELIYPIKTHLRPRDYLFRLPYSAAQCFVSGFGGVHMYSAATAKQELITWRGTGHKMSFGLPRDSHDWVHAIQDIQEEQASKNYVIRSTLDTASLLFEWPNDIRWPTDYWNCALRQSLHFSWLERGSSPEASYHTSTRHLGPSSTGTYLAFRSGLLPYEPDKAYLLGHGIETS